MTEKRRQKFQTVACRRQKGLTVILENVHDQHNIGAALRSCDSVGISEVFVLYSEPGIAIKNVTLGKRTSSGARQWVDVQYFTDITACFQFVRQSYPLIFCAHPHADSLALYELNLTNPIALLFGNEKAGVSKRALELCDGSFVIPQMGMTESLNVSVACAVTLYEAYRQRNTKGFYAHNPTTTAVEKEAIFQEFCQRHEKGEKRRLGIKKD